VIIVKNIKTQAKRLTTKSSGRNFFAHSQLSKANLIAIAIIFAGIGAYILQGSKAATTCDLNATTANAQSQVNAAQAGQTVCLAAGNYGQFGVNLVSTKTNPGITIRAADGVNRDNVQFSLYTGASSNVIAWTTLQNVRITGGSICAPAHDFTIDNAHFSQKVLVSSAANNNQCSSAPAMNNNHIAITNSYFDYSDNAKGDSGYEGLIELLGSSAINAGVTIGPGNNFDATTTNFCADAIQVTDGGGTGVTITGNEIHGIVQSGCESRWWGGQPGPHSDAIQFVGGANASPIIQITNNYIHDQSQGIVAYDGGPMNAVISGNVITRIESDAMSLGGFPGVTINHNTMAGENITVSDTHAHLPSTNVIAKNNIASGLSAIFGGSFSSSSSNNLCSSGCGVGSNNITGTPTYTGGSSPSNWAGFTLLSNSLGKNGASDGLDIGATSFGGGIVTPPPPPPPSDTTPPTVSLTAPTSGATVSGSSVTLSANASDNVGVTSVEFYLDGNPINTDSTSPYSFLWDSRTVANGSYGITAKAYDAAGNVTTSVARTIITNNTSTCSITSSAWQNQSFTASTSTFTATFDATPGDTPIDSLVGFSSGAANAFSNLAVIVRFNSGGTIDAVNGSGPGGNYTADATITYVANTSYHFVLTINPSTHTYSADVTPRSEETTRIASNYPFRSEQATLSSFSNWATLAVSGSHSTCGMTIANVSPLKPADLNNDGIVNITDLSILLSNYSKTAAQLTNPKVDINNDGVVSIFDLSALLSVYGT
jgi:hypothetical protein